MLSHFRDKKRSDMRNIKIRSAGQSAYLSESIKISTKTHEYHITELNVGKRIIESASTFLRDGLFDLVQCLWRPWKPLGRLNSHTSFPVNMLKHLTLHVLLERLHESSFF
jgi:hypothetical protein